MNEQYEVGQLYSVPVNDVLVVAENNGRRFGIGKVDDLVQSIVEQGQLQPVEAKLNDGNLQLVYGFRRHAAITSINQSKLTKKPLEIKVTIIDDVDDATALMRNVAENEKRKDLSPVDRAWAIQRLTKPVEEGGMGKTQSEVATLFGKHKSWVSLTVRLLDLPAKVQRMVHDGKVRVGASYDLISMDEDDRAAIIAELLEGKDPDTINITRADVRKVERKRRSKGKGAKKGKGKAKGNESKQLTVKEVVLEIESYVGKTEQEAWGPPQKVMACVLEWVSGKYGLKALASRITDIHDNEA